jgi:hypothetical protein
MVRNSPNLPRWLRGPSALELLSSVIAEME